MKVAFFVNKFPCISETFILNQVTGLIDRGHEVTIYSFEADDSLKEHADINRYDLLNKSICIGNISKSKLLRTLKILSLSGDLFVRRPIKLLRILSKYKNIRIVSIYSILLLVNLNTEKFDIICCHFGPNGLKALYLRECGAIEGKIVTIFHGVDIADSVQLALGTSIYDRYKRLFISGDYFLSVSDFWLQKLIRLGCDSSKADVHHMGVDCKQFSTSRNKESEKIRLVSIARLVEKKGIEYGIIAASLLIDRHKEIEYLIVGDGELKTHLEKVTAELNLSSFIKFTGSKQRSEVANLLSTADILIAPSITANNGDKEGIPVVIMEAMSMCLPVVSTFHSGIPELVKDGVSGYLVPEKDAGSLAEKVSHLILNPNLRTKMGKKGRSIVDSDYNIERLNTTLVSRFKQIIEKSK